MKTALGFGAAAPATTVTAASTVELRIVRSQCHGMNVLSSAHAELLQTLRTALDPDCFRRPPAGARRRRSLCVREADGQGNRSAKWVDALNAAMIRRQDAAPASVSRIVPMSLRIGHTKLQDVCYPDRSSARDPAGGHSFHNRSSAARRRGEMTRWSWCSRGFG